MISVKILGTTCSKCKQLEENARKAVESSGVEAKVEKVSDINEMLDYGIMMTPALVIDDTVKSVGKVLTPDEIKSFLI
jgi:small redox-active disulfide protein 2